MKAKSNFSYYFIIAILSATLMMGCKEKPDHDLSGDTEINNQKAGDLNRITAADAVKSALQYINNSEWEIAFLSNTGIPSSVTSSHIQSAADGLMLSNGHAGQWVVEFFKDSPTIIKNNGKEGNSYPFRRLLVTAKGVEELPESDLGVPNRLAQLKSEYIDAFDKALKLAISDSKERFDIISASSDVRSSGECFWRFRFYDLQSGNIVNQINTSGDGKRIVKI